MGIKGELGGGFPQLKPAFTLIAEWDAAFKLGPTTYPNNNHLSYLKVSSGTLKSVPDSSLPPLAAEIVDGGVSLREETLPSGEKWLKGEAVVLLRVVEPSNTAADPEMETGLIRLKYNGVGSWSDTVTKPTLESDFSELARVLPRENEPGSAGILTYTFETGDQRYKYLEHAVYVGNARMKVVPAEERPEGHRVIYEMKISYLAA